MVRENNGMKANKLSINKTKTKAMTFHTPQRRVYYPYLQVEDSAIEFVEEFNFLGIIVDKNLNWRPNVIW